MARRQAFFGEDRAGREGQRRLGDVVGGFRLEFLGKRLALLLRGSRSDQHSVTSGAVDLLDDQFGHVLQHVFDAVRLRAAPGRNVAEDRLAAGVELHDLGHVGIDRLVVGDAGAGRIGDGDVAGAIDVHDAGHAERGVRPERQRIEISVVNAAVEHVDLLVALGRAHGDMAVGDTQILPLDKLHTHLVSQEGVLEIGGVETAWRQHGDGGRTGDPIGLHRRQRLAQQRRIIFDRSNLDLLEQLRKELHHRLAVLQHVGNARGRARIVLQNEEIVLAGTHDVDADDVGVDAGGWSHADHFRQEGIVAGDELLRNAAGAQDLLPVVDVVEKGVQRLDALFYALRQPPPFLAGHDARHDIERYQPFRRFLLSIDGEGDAGLAKDALGILHLLHQPGGVLLLKPVVIGGVRPSRTGGFRKHFVKSDQSRTPPCRYLKVGKGEKSSAIGYLRVRTRRLGEPAHFLGNHSGRRASAASARGTRRKAALECPEGDGRERVLDSGNHLDLLVDEMPHIHVVVDIELGHQVEIAGGGIDFRGDLGVGQRAGDLIGLTEVAFDLHEKRLHRLTRLCRIATLPCRKLPARFQAGR